MPVRSSGCATCRKRRIRCDETRPHCKRCATHGVPCPGYRIAQPGGVEFKDVTEYTAQRATDTYKQKGYAYTAPPAKRSSVSTSSSGSSSSKSSTSERSTPLSEVDGTVTTRTEFTTNDLAMMQTWSDTLFPVTLISALQANPPVSQQLHSTTLMSTQIYANFLDIYVPPDTPVEQNFFQELALRPNHEPALIRSLNALSLVTVGAVRRDRVVVQEAVMEYGRALVALASKVGKPGFVPTDEVHAAVTILALCEFYDAVKQEGGWAKHMAGAAGMLVARGGPKKVRSRLGLLMVSNAKHPALAQSLLLRKECLLGKKAWREVLFKCPVVDQSTYFYAFALQVPGFLQRLDELDVGSPLVLAEADELLVDMAKIELELRTWFTGWAPVQPLTGKPLYEKVPIEEFPTFTSCVKDRTFEEAFEFPNYPFGYLCCMYYCTLHFLRSAMLTLYKTRANLDSSWERVEEDSAVAADLRHLADNICRCLPFFCEPRSSVSGHIGIFLPIGTIGPYFRKIGDVQRLQWLQEVHNNVFINGLSPPK